MFRPRTLVLADVINNRFGSNSGVLLCHVLHYEDTLLVRSTERKCFDILMQLAMCNDHFSNSIDRCHNYGLVVTNRWYELSCINYTIRVK